MQGIEGLTVVGRGGFATVYRGRQPAFHRDVAVKVLQRSELDTDDRRRFERECQAMGALSNHPGIVTLYDAGFTADERPYLVMSYVPDGSLQDRLSRGPIPWQEVTVIGVRLAGALETAHRAGVVHRDVKPANVLRSAYGEQLTDFGIARLQGGHETLSGVITASVAHAAPEILDGEPPSVQADIYALGSTLYAALAGSAAYVKATDEGLLALIHRVGTAPLPDLREKGVPDVLASTIEKAMAKNPRDRYETAEDFGHAICDAQAALGLNETDLMIVGGKRDRSPTTASPTRVVSPLDHDTARPPILPDPPTTQLPSDRRPPAPPPPPGPSSKQDRSPIGWLLGVGALAIVAIVAFLLLSTDDDTPAPAASADTAVADPTAAPGDTTAATEAQATADTATADTATADTATADTTADTAPATGAETTETAPTTEQPDPGPPPTETVALASTAIDPATEVGGTPLTGIDGIAYDPFRQELLAAREPAPPAIGDAVPALVTPAAFSIPIELPTEGSDGVIALDYGAGSAVTLLREDGTPYGAELDVEGMAVLPDGTFYVLSEGAQDDPAGDPGFFAHRFAPDGRFISELPLPPWYQPNAEGTQGFDASRGLHGIDQRPGAPDEVVAIVEFPLVQDHERGARTEPKFSRITAFDVDTGEATAEWAYPLDQLPADVAEVTESSNHVVDMAALADGSLAVLENTGTVDGREYLLYRIRLDDGVPPSGDLPPALTKTPIPLAGDATDALDQFRSITAGPALADGRSSLLLASDNAFDNAPTIVTMLAIGAES